MSLTFKELFIFHRYSVLDRKKCPILIQSLENAYNLTTVVCDSALTHSTNYDDTQVKIEL